jgi:hypothetical protein
VRIDDAHGSTDRAHDCPTFCGDNGGANYNRNSDNGRAMRAVVLQRTGEYHLPSAGMPVLRRFLRKNNSSPGDDAVGYHSCVYHSCGYHSCGHHSFFGADDNSSARVAGDDNCTRNRNSGAHHGFDREMQRGLSGAR